VLGGVFEFCELFCVFEIFLALLYHFALVCYFSCPLLALPLSLLLDDLSEFFLGFSSSSYMLYGVLDSNFKLCAFYCQCTYQGGIKKASGQFLGLIVMSQI
jgi:hypothetical protein